MVESSRVRVRSGVPDDDVAGTEVDLYGQVGRSVGRVGAGVGVKEQGFGAGYAYDHDAEDGFSGQDYFPETMKRPVLYAPIERGFERELKKRLDYFTKLRMKRDDQT